MKVSVKFDHGAVHVSDWKRSNASDESVLGAEGVYFRDPDGSLLEFTSYHNA